MLREGPIPVFVQGIIEYLLGLFFIAAPFLMDYDGSSAPLGISITVGVLLLIIAAISDSPTGLVKQLPITAHVTIDFLLSIFLIAAPFVLGFGDEATPRNLFIAAGVVFLLVTIGTRFREAGKAPAAAKSAPAPASRPAATPAPAPAKPVASSAPPARPAPAPAGPSGSPTTSKGSSGPASTGSTATTSGMPPPARPLDPPSGGSKPIS